MVEPDEDNTAWRRTLRREMVAKRAALGDEAHAGLSAGIVGHLLTALPAPQVVAFCWPIKHEPDVRAVVAHWEALGARAALPVVVAEAAPLAFRLWTPDTKLAPDRYGIPTPISGDFIQPDLILLPLEQAQALQLRQHAQHHVGGVDLLQRTAGERGIGLGIDAVEQHQPQHGRRLC